MAFTSLNHVLDLPLLEAADDEDEGMLARGRGHSAFDALDHGHLRAMLDERVRDGVTAK
jgi:hypothetical protein